MEDKLSLILQCIGSRHLSELWLFFRDYFSNDASCLEFIYDCAKIETALFKKYYIEDTKRPGVFISKDGEEIHDEVFVPRRMLNCVERMVSAARDMEQIRRGKDVFKIVFIVTCVETLQKLGGRDKYKNGKEKHKKDLLFDFFETYTSEEDKLFIAKRFAHDDEEQIDSKKQEDSFRQFIGVLNEYRNCAAHEGDYWNYCFNNNFNRDEYPILLVLELDIENYSGNKKKKKEHCFRTQISYHEFEDIFVRTCISFIENYVSSQEDTDHADT